MENQLTDLQKAQKLIETENKKQLDVAQNILNEAIEKIKAMGFILSIAGKFKGSQIETIILLDKI